VLPDVISVCTAVWTRPLDRVSAAREQRFILFFTRTASKPGARKIRFQTRERGFLLRNPPAWTLSLSAKAVNNFLGTG